MSILLFIILVIAFCMNPIGMGLFYATVAFFAWLFFWAPEWVLYAFAAWGIAVALGFHEFCIGLWEGYHKDDT